MPCFYSWSDPESARGLGKSHVPTDNPLLLDDPVRDSGRKTNTCQGRESSPQSLELLCFIGRKIIGQVFADIELNFAGDHILVSQELQLSNSAPFHHLEDYFLGVLAESENEEEGRSLISHARVEMEGIFYYTQ